MNNLFAGFARSNINPMLGIGLTGYFIDRESDGILDDLELTVLALQCGKRRALLATFDLEGIRQTTADEMRRHASEVTGVPYEAIFISATHTHTGPFSKGDPFIHDERNEKLAEEYTALLNHRLADTARAAIEDLKPARMGMGVGQAPNVAFVRRFVMKDGSIRTNPGVDNPDILRPLGDVDERVNVLRFDQENGYSIVLANFGNHPDVVGGNKVSADWPGMTRRTVEKAIDNTKCIFFNGAQGDVNHVNVHPRGGYLNGMFMDFDDVARGYAHAQYIARVVTGGVLQAFDKVEYVDVESIDAVQRTIDVPANVPDPADMPLAHKYNDLHRAGRDDEIPFEGMQLTTVVAEAGRMVCLENGPEAFPMHFAAVRIGPVALFGMPGEPFTGIGRALKEAEGYALVLPCCLTNGNEGYFPMRDAYDEGGYEARSSYFKAGVAELIIAEGKKLLSDMK